eukprot:TRINITY_DN123659_c0_g1_i1.p1 TRINITY_DN123659_c0_g1~~TRINITY_DN123659_c0_g1_i1.p1  ORF type:complete len:108 (+),score=23.73 TRINITY_DN123659_c0_g1_i1:74-397(+)
MAARRATLLPAFLLAFAALCVLSQSMAFVGGSVQPKTSLRSASTLTRNAVPADLSPLVDASSLSTALQVSGAAYIFNILILVFPCAFLVFLFLYSERTLSEEEKSAA